MFFPHLQNFVSFGLLFGCFLVFLAVLDELLGMIFIFFPGFWWQIRGRRLGVKANGVGRLPCCEAERALSLGSIRAGGKQLVAFCGIKVVGKVSL